MSRSAPLGMGVAVLAALVVGRTIDAALPDASDVRPFVHSGEVGDRVSLAYADVTVDGVRTARTVSTDQSDVVARGTWLVVDMTVVARGEPLATPGISLHDANGRTFRTDLFRSGYSWVAAPTGIPWHVCIPFEVPEDALAGATLRLSRTDDDDRRDDVASIDLGIDAADADDLFDSTETVEVTQAGMKT